MPIKFLIPPTGKDAQNMVMRFKRDGFNPISAQGIHSGFVKTFGEQQYVFLPI